MTYLKTNYPLEFFASLLSSFVGNFTKIQSYQQEASKFRIKIIQPDINHSTDKFLIKDGQILYPLTSIQGFGASAYKAIREDIQENGEYKDIIDFFVRTSVKGIKSNTIIALIDSGALSEFNYGPMTLKNSIEDIDKYLSIVISGKGKSKEINSEVYKTSIKPNIVQISENEEINTENQYKAIGIYVKESPIIAAKKQLREVKNMNIVDMSQTREMIGNNVILLAQVTSARSVKTKYGGMMMFGNLEDDTGVMPFSVSPKYFSSIVEKIERGVTGIVYAKVDKFKDGTISIEDIKVMKNEK